MINCKYDIRDILNYKIDRMALNIMFIGTILYQHNVLSQIPLM